MSGWDGVGRLPTRGNVDRTAVNALLQLPLDADSLPTDSNTLIKALRASVAALKSEKSRSDAAEQRAIEAARARGNEAAQREIDSLRERLARKGWRRRWTKAAS